MTTTDEYCKDYKCVKSRHPAITKYGESHGRRSPDHDRSQWFLCASHAHYANVIANLGYLARSHCTFTCTKEVLKRYQRVVLIGKLRPRGR